MQTSDYIAMAALFVAFVSAGFTFWQARIAKRAENRAKDAMLPAVNLTFFRDDLWEGWIRLNLRVTNRDDVALIATQLKIAAPRSVLGVVDSQTKVASTSQYLGSTRVTEGEAKKLLSKAIALNAIADVRGARWSTAHVNVLLFATRPLSSPTTLRMSLRVARTCASDEYSDIKLVTTMPPTKTSTAS